MADSGVLCAGAARANGRAAGRSDAAAQGAFRLTDLHSAAAAIRTSRAWGHWGTTGILNVGPLVMSHSYNVLASGPDGRGIGRVAAGRVREARWCSRLTWERRASEAVTWRGALPRCLCVGTRSIHVPASLAVCTAAPWWTRQSTYARPDCCSVHSMLQVCGRWGCGKADAA